MKEYRVLCLCENIGIVEEVFTDKEKAKYFVEKMGEKSLYTKIEIVNHGQFEACNSDNTQIDDGKTFVTAANLCHDIQNLKGGR